ncbi:MAG: aspartyl/glutamyl-tRNA amidotransferase subunit A [Verrucomicrobia bacterium]|nr:aspartyl/glutamyl-tRNA amidotransferase subunit A [Verrucomicrobiota bacterium]
MTAASSCWELAASVQRGERSARAIAEVALAEAGKKQARFRPFIRLTPELAREEAGRVDQLIAQGQKPPLAGVPFAVKDLLDVRGLPTTGGSPAFADRVPGEDATVVRRMVGAGAVCIGKLNMHECAYGFTGENPHFGDCRNPWDEQRIPGGSSSGSAVAVALDLCPLTIGSDSGGSIRLPAALCGVVGLKPTYGRISRAGGIPLSWTLDHLGPFARSAEDVASMLQVMAGHDPADESSSKRGVPDYRAELEKPVKGLRIGRPRDAFFRNVDPEVLAAVEAALRQLRDLGVTLVDVTLPHLPEVLGAHRAIIFSEASSYYRTVLADRGEKIGDGIRPNLEAGMFIPAVDYLQAQRVRRVVRQAWARLFAQVDCLATPTVPMTAPRFGQQTVPLPSGEMPLVNACLDNSLPFNFSGHPALTIPCGFSAGGLPIGLQLVGRPYDEPTLLRLAHHYQQHTDWHRRRPV